MSNEDITNSDWKIDRRTALKAAGIAGVGIYGFSGAATASGGGPPGQSCDCDDSEGEFIAKYDFECVEEECVDDEWEEEDDPEECTEWECVEWDFVLTEGEDVVDITVTKVKDDEEDEPITVEFSADGYVVQSVCAFGGTDTDTTEDEDGVTSFETDLTNPGGQQAAISNLTFCGVEEETLPQCPVYGTSRSDPTSIFSIRYDPDSGEVIEQEVGDIPDESSNSNYPNGLAFDPDNEIWYFAEEGGILKTMNEDGALGIKVYEGISGGSNIAAAAFYDGGYYYTPQGGNTLWRAELDGDDVIVDDNVCSLPRGNNTFGDIAIDRDEANAYFSVNGAFFKVDLVTCDGEIIVESTDRDNFAVLSQIAFAEETLWAHHAGNGEWRTVDVSNGSLSDLVDTTREYTDLAQCGFYEIED